MKQINCQDVTGHRASRSISDDDICAGCKNLFFCPGELSLCAEAIDGKPWPAEFDTDGYAIACSRMRSIEVVGENWARGVI